jgi:hypothetical protein
MIFMTLDEAIKCCEDMAEKDKRIAEFCNNVEPHTEFFEKETEKYFQIADWLKILKDIQSTGSCNTCKSRRMCEYEPEVGQMARYNCPFYKEEKIIKSRMTYGMIYDEFCKKFPNVEVSDFRPAIPMYIPGISNLTKGIPNAIVIWLTDGGSIIYIAEEVKDD